MSAQHVLIVEDDAWLGEQQKRVLEGAGYGVTLTPHAIDAIDAIDRIHPDVILLDVLLTATTGFTLLHELQSYSDTSVIPIVLCTNLAPDISLRDVEVYGVKRILDKSTMAPDDVVAAVRAVLL